MIASPQERYSIKVKICFSLIVLFIALLPRVVQLNQYLGPDEMAQWGRSNRFLLALLNFDWAGTHMNDDTGNLTLMWLESGGVTVRYLWQQLQGQNSSLRETIPLNRPIEKLADARLILAVVNSLLILLTFWGVTHLFNGSVGFIAALLIALDPFFLSESRMLRSEALYTAFMGLTVIVFLLYIKQRHWMFLGLSGMLAGLAISSKISGLFLLAFIPLSLTIHSLIQIGYQLKARQNGRSIIKQWLVAHGVWGVCCALTMFLLWPALWVRAWNILQSTLRIVEYSGLEGKKDEQFFMGGLWDNLPTTYYLAVIPFRTTPLVMIGVLLLLVGLLIWAYHSFYKNRPPIDVQMNLDRPLSEKPNPQEKSNNFLTNYNDIFSILTLIAYIGLYTLLFSLAANKTDRYILVTLWTLDILAGIGLVWSINWIVRYWHKSIQQATFATITGVVILWQGYLVAQIHPYYTAYYNPWLGGHENVAEMFQLGYGAGVKQIMTYLNQKPNSTKIRVVCGTNEPRCAQIFHGDTWQRRTLNSVNGRWVLADYIMIYITQKQRELYPPGIVEYLERQPAEQVALVNGLPYAWLYQAPQADNYGHAADLTGVGTILGYNMTMPEELQANDEVTLHVWWQNRGTQEKTLVAQVIDLAGYVWVELPLMPYSGFEMAQQQDHQIVESTGKITLPLGMSTGEYFLRFAFRLAEEPDMLLWFEIPLEETNFMIEAAPPETGVATAQNSINVEVAEGLTLIGHDLTQTTAQSGQEIWLPLIWQTTATIDRDYVILIRLVGTDNTEAAFWLGRPVQSSQSTNSWQAGQIIKDPWHLTLPAEIELGSYEWELALFDADTKEELNRLSLGTLELLEADQ
ncbi:glycosyltransferase family 39 protein [Anaerolineales bacterium HSG24]|nr:glycosyltransferase family 39 protein [Anaerolineales bacterium HSG24]